MDLQSALNNLAASAPTPQETGHQPQQLLQDMPVEQPDNVEQTVADNVETTEPVREEMAQPQLSENELQRRENLKNLREINKRLEWERNEALRLVEEARRQAKPIEEPDDIGLSEDDYTSRKHVSKIIQRELTKQQKEFMQKQQQLENLLIESQLERQYPDFKQVLSSENIKRLAELKPHHVRNITYSPNYRDQLESTYELIKEFKIDESIYQDKENQQVKARIDKNLARPKSSANVQSVASSSLSKVASYEHELTPDRKAQLYAEMKAAQKRAGF